MANGGGGGQGATAVIQAPYGRPLPRGQLQRAGQSGATLEVRDEEGRYHCETGPALILGYSSRYYFWHGMASHEWVILHPEHITLERIADEGSVEAQRVMIARYRGRTPDDGLDGYKRYIRDAGGVVDTDRRFGTLLAAGGLWEPYAAVRVKDATKQKNGSRKEFYLRVPPWMKTAREAVAWTFDQATLDYNPKIET